MPNRFVMDKTRLAVDSLVFFFYGLGFFVLGIVTAIQYRPRSEFHLARSIWALAGFGLTHAASEWVDVFLPIQREILSPLGILHLNMVKEVVNAASFSLLFHFGLELLNQPNSRLRHLSRIQLFLTLVWVVLWYQAAHVAHAVPLNVDQAQAWLQDLDVFARYLLALPGGLATGFALLRQARQFKTTGPPQLIPPLRTAAVSFFAYTVLAGLIVPTSHFGLASLVNTETFHRFFGVPVQLFRLMVVVPMTLSVVQVLTLFDREAERRLEEAETQRAILNERLRISRDLHDGVMQSIYGVGLALENVTFLMGENPEKARQNLERSMLRLNDTIQEIRGYILNLRPARANRSDLYASLLEVVARFRSASTVRLSLGLEPARGVQLDPATVDEVCHIVREALTNVARHARATKAHLEARRAFEGGLDLVVRDNGQGFAAGGETGSDSQGLGNMQERANLLGAKLHIVSRPGWGTEVALRLPVAGGATGEPKDQGRAG